MNTWILTGVNKGLGRAVHDLLISEKYSRDRKIFLSRSFPKNRSASKLSSYKKFEILNESATIKNIEIDQRSNAVIFINNAATINPISKANQIDSVDLELAMNANFNYPFALAQYLDNECNIRKIKLLILNVTSGAALKPIVGWFTYCVSKSAMRMALSVLDLEGDNTRVVHFDPGVMDTDMQKVIRDQPETVVPLVSLFKSYETNGILRDPNSVALELLELVESSSR